MFAYKSILFIGTCILSLGFYHPIYKINVQVYLRCILRFLVSSPPPPEDRSHSRHRLQNPRIVTRFLFCCNVSCPVYYTYIYILHQNVHIIYEKKKTRCVLLHHVSRRRRPYRLLDVPPPSIDGLGKGLKKKKTIITRRIRELARLLRCVFHCRVSDDRDTSGTGVHSLC